VKEYIHRGREINWDGSGESTGRESKHVPGGGGMGGDLQKEGTPAIKKVKRKKNRKVGWQATCRE